MNPRWLVEFSNKELKEINSEKLIYIAVELMQYQIRILRELMVRQE